MFYNMDMLIYSTIPSLMDIMFAYTFFYNEQSYHRYLHTKFVYNHTCVCAWVYVFKCIVKGQEEHSLSTEYIIKSGITE